MPGNNERGDCWKAIAAPWDLRSWVRERTLVQLALNAVQTVSLKAPRANNSQDGGPQMTLTLLSYCYSVGTYGSQDIAWAARHESTPRYICAHNYPEWRVLRWFRRHYRQQLKECLAYIIKQAWALKFEPAETNDDDYGWPAWNLNEEIENLVDHKLAVAVLMDRTAMEV